MHFKSKYWHYQNIQDFLHWKLILHINQRLICHLILPVDLRSNKTRAGKNNCTPNNRHALQVLEKEAAAMRTLKAFWSQFLATSSETTDYFNNLFDQLKQAITRIVLILYVHTKRQGKLSKTTMRCSSEIRNQEYEKHYLYLPDTGVRTNDHLKFPKRLHKNFFEASLPKKPRNLTEIFVFYICNYYFSLTQCLESLKGRSLSLLHFRKLNE